MSMPYPTHRRLYIHLAFNIEGVGNFGEVQVHLTKWQHGGLGHGDSTYRSQSAMQYNRAFLAGPGTPSGRSSPAVWPPKARKRDDVAEVAADLKLRVRRKTLAFPRPFTLGSALH